MKHSASNSVATQVKDPDLVSRRRRQIVDAAVRLFIEKGFHKTTTREIAREAGISIGLLYEYVRTKEDVLFLVCEAIHREVQDGVREALARAERGSRVLAEMIKRYFLVCDRMRDHILLIYQETATLPLHWKKIVLENEVRISNLFFDALMKLAKAGDISENDETAVRLMAHNIVVLGHMWTFRRWYLRRHYSIQDYIHLQTEFILGQLTGKENRADRKCPAGEAVEKETENEGT